MSEALKLSKAARERLEFEGEHYGPSPYDYVPEMAAEALTRPPDSTWRDDELFVTHTLMFSYSPLADDLIGESNYHSILAALQDEFPGDDRVSEAGFGSWTYAHFDAIRVRVLDKRGRITPEFAVAAVIAHRLIDYPLFDDEDYSEREWNAWHESLDSGLNYATGDVELSDADRARIEEWVTEHYYGYSDPGWVDSDWIVEAAQALSIDLGK